jgi:hypothetical protein
MDFSISNELVDEILAAKQNEKKNQAVLENLHRRILEDFWKSQLNKRNLFTLSISNEMFDNIQLSVFPDKLKLLNDIIRENNYIQINEECDVIESKRINGNTQEIKTKLESESLNKYVFFFGEEGITLFQNGKAIQDNNFFYSQEDRIRFSKKRDISQLETVLDEYSTQYITQQVNYMCILADNSTLRQINPDLVSHNILRNKPERYMRDQLCQYLTDHMQYNFYVEVELSQSKKRNDIFFDVRGELYFIEIKWIGVSINDKGTGLSTEYGEARVRKGVTQTLEYIKELLNTSEKSLRTGYLLVYDARDDKSEINFQDYEFVNQDLKAFLPVFKYLKPIPINKTHPA